ncbi:MAG: hypothetical protein Q7T55_06010, partial [Solirubrobacteraceae bacterium]|nr:hypothetical protein [Solirubrobacteraceae bacterium]
VLTKLRPTAARARRLTDALPALFKNVNPALTTLPTFADTGTETVPKAEGALRQLNPFLAYLTPYKNEITGFLENWSSGYTFNSIGVTARCQCVFDVNTIANFPGDARKLLAPLLDQGAVSAVTKETENHYRVPGGPQNPADLSQNYKVIKPDTTPNQVVK